MMSTPRMQYATDVTDAQWRRIEPLLPSSRWQSFSGRPTREGLQCHDGISFNCIEGLCHRSYTVADECNHHCYTLGRMQSRGCLHHQV